MGDFRKRFLKLEQFSTALQQASPTATFIERIVVKSGGEVPNVSEERVRLEFDRGPAADLWRHTLSQIPTIFGRLVYLSSLRDPNTGVYHHYGLAQRFDEESADQTLRESHLKAFSE